MIHFRHISATEQASVVEPVTLDEVKTWGNIDHDDDDDLLLGMITGARQDIEGETNLKLVANDVVLYGETFSTSELFTLPYGVPTDLVVNEIDSDGVETALETDYYGLKGDSLALSYEGDFGVTYSTGTTVSTSLKEAIKMLVVYRYENNRGDNEKQQGIPEDVKAKIRKDIQVWL